MLWPFFAPEEALHHARIDGATDDFGNEVTAWADPRPILNDAGKPASAFDPGGTVEPMLPGQERVITTPTLYVPFGQPIRARDQITVRGRRWEVDGDPADWKNPLVGWKPGTVVKLKEVTG